MRSLRLAVSLSLLVTLAGCSLDPVSTIAGAFTEKPSLEVDTEIVAGDKKQEVQVGSKQTAEVINITTKQEIPIEFILLLCLGWLLPSPGEICKGILSIFKRK